MQTVTQSETYQNEIGGLDQRISTAESKLTPEAMETTIENSEALSEVRQTADKINWIVESGTSSSNMTLTDDALSVISEGITLTADKINLVADDINLSGNSSVSTIVSNAVGPLETDIDSLTTRMTQAETSITQNTEAIELRATKEEVQTAQETADSAQEVAEQATPLTGAEPPEEAPAAGKLWIDEGQTPSVWRRWRGADVPTDREYDEMISGDADSPAFVAIDNTQGQLQTVALEAGCVAQQAGAGDPSPSNIRAITGRESVDVRACGKNLYDVNDRKAFSDSVTVDADGWITVTADNSAGDGFVYMNCMTSPSIAIRPSTQYAVVCEIAQINVSGSLYFSIVSTENDVMLSQFAQAFTLTVNENTQTGTRIQVLTSRADLSDAGTMLRTYVGFLPGASGTIKFRLSVLADTAITAETFVYEPYRSMGGGAVTPSEPLYGLPDAEDTVEVDASGDVTVTRRTAVVELDGTEYWLSYAYGDEVDDSILVAYMEFADADLRYQTSINSHFKNLNAAWRMNTPWTYSDNQTVHNKYFVVPKSQIADIAAWKSWLAAQKAAGTPVTIVYELAVPETEALTAISPIVPEAGPVNVWTDADTLTATTSGSGWETVNDTSSIQDALANLDGDLASLINEVGLLNGEVGSIAQQIISPDGIKNIVFESSEYQAMANTVELNANELSVTQATVTDINGRVETIEGTVRISGSNIDIGRSDSNVQLHLDNTGWSISDGGQETIYARQNRVVAPRFQTTSLIFGALAFNSSGGHFRLMKYGG